MRSGVVRMGLLLLSTAAGACSTNGSDTLGLDGTLERIAADKRPCIRDAPTREYIEEMWRAFEVAWQVSSSSPLDSGVRVRIAFDADGVVQAPQIVGESQGSLLPSVQTALRDAKLPEPQPSVRACLANRALIATFSVATR